jgi:hypothetical protein
MLLDELMPRYDAVRSEHRVMPGDVERAFAAVRETDFLATVSESPVVRLLFGVRALGERAVGVVTDRPAPGPAPTEPLRLADLGSHGEWVLLGEDPPHEIAFGAAGRFWAGDTSWEELDATAFPTLDRPGLAKIACNFSLRPYGVHNSLISYECRTLAGDDATRRSFLRYWRALSPFIAVVLRAQLATIAREATRRELARDP